MHKQLAAELHDKIIGRVHVDEPMSKYTTWHIGGPADVLVLPETINDVVQCYKAAQEYAVPITTVGNGSNLLVLDGGIRGMVLVTTKLRDIIFDNTRVVTKAGMFLPTLARVCAQKGLAGLENLSAIPGTVGGASVINAGAFGTSLGEMVAEVLVIETNGGLRKIANNEMDFGYRYSSLKDNDNTVLEVTLQLKQDEPEAILKRMFARLEERRTKQPLGYPNAGSVFKNPVEGAAGYYLEKVGAKGLRKGDVQVSEKHANFMVNLGKAKARDVLDLIKEVQKRVRDTFGIELELEIEIIGHPEGAS